jgi:20S proteasome subunit alpha 1
MSRGNFDKVITVFSPEGGLYQVEYAFNAVKAGGVTSVAICGKDSACVVTQRKVPDKLMKGSSLTNMYLLNKHIGACVTGRVPDGRSVINEARQDAFDYEYDYGVSIPIGTLAKRVADRAQVFTQEAGTRAMGVTVTLVGIDREDSGALRPRVYKCDPAGHFVGYFATASGQKEVDATAQLEKRQKQKPFDELTAAETIECCLAVLQQVLGESLKAKDVEVAAVSVERPIFTVLPDAQIEAVLTSLAERDN